MDPSQTCSAISLAVGEPLLGTAPTADEWLLVEHTGPWERDPIDSLPPRARVTVATWLEEGNRRLQLVRRPDRKPDGRGVLTVRADLSERKLFGLRLPALEDVRIPAPGERLDHPMILVCVHGRRDRCCAEHGRGVVQALDETVADHLWETSHLGGHRFAATAAVLPVGRVMGRLRPETSTATILAALADEPTDHDRGRAGLRERTQVEDVHGSAQRGAALSRPASCGSAPEAIRPWVPTAG